MEINDICKSMIDSADSPVVICSLDYRIIYMNQCAQEIYKEYGGASMIGKTLYAFMSEETKSKVDMTVEWFREDKNNNKVFTYCLEKENKDVYLIAIRDENGELAAFGSRHEKRTPETGKPYDFD